MNAEKLLYYIDLFAGCGGLSLGLYNSGWKGLFAIEKSKDAFATLKYNLIDKCNHYNWPDWLPIKNHDINEVIDEYRNELEKLHGKIALLVGGPPCQGFSLAGRRNEGDERNRLVDSYIEFVRIVKPKLLFLENVMGFTIGFKKENERSKPYSLYVKEKLEEMGYNVSGKMLELSEYGIPQRRNRFILIGSLDMNPEIFFDILIKNRENILKEKGLKLTHSLEEAISDLKQSNGEIDSPDSKGFKSGIYSEAHSAYQRYLRKDIDFEMKVVDSHRFANHRKDTVEVFIKIQNAAVKNKRIDGDKRKQFGLKKRGVFLLDEKQVSPTLTTHPDDYIHYCEPRILTVREYARIQSFPDWYEFKGKYTTGGERRVKEVPRYTQLGNAIPPLFGEQVGIALKEMLGSARK